MEIIFILGIAAFILLTIAFKMEEKHTIVKFFSLMFAIFCLLMIGNTALKSNIVCSTEISNKTLVNNITTYNYERQCFTDTTNQNITNSFFKTMLWYFRLMIVYLLGFMIYLILNYLQEVNKMKKP